MLNPYGVVYLPENRCNLPQVSEKMCREAKILITYYFQGGMQEYYEYFLDEKLQISR
ncbi:MAG: hypothetical protein QNJ51_10760 [Calothrix sp. MO_167.B12]|nr:hypothetical protein [Calothrix sp. MO_167.B12]